MATENYTKKDWATGDTIDEASLDNMESGIATAVAGVQALEKQIGEAGGSITQVKVTTLEAGESATASLDAGILTLGIPKGAQGPKGDPGEDGAPGTPAKDGTNGTNGADGEDGAPGAAGKDGKDGAPGQRGSKIEFVTQAPTETEGYLDGDIAINKTDWKLYAFSDGSWAEKGTIKGADGQKGADGAPGADGEDGQAGAAGKDGAAGKQGASYRISTETFSESKADCQASAVSPGASVLPIIVGDLIEDASGAVWQVASVADGTFTVGAAAVKNAPAA